MISAAVGVAKKLNLENRSFENINFSQYEQEKMRVVTFAMIWPTLALY